MKGADCLVVLTEWNEFRALDPSKIKALLKNPVVVDLRNVFAPGEMTAAGIRYTSICRPTGRQDT